LSEREENEETEDSGRPGVPVDPLRLWNALRRRWQLVLAAGVLGAFVGAAVAKKFAEQTFVAHGVLTWDATAPAEIVERRTIIESMTMVSNLEEVRKRLKLDMPARMLGNVITVTTSIDTNNIGIDSTWPTAEGAADVINALIDVFLESRKNIIRTRLQSTVSLAREAELDAQKRQQQALNAYDEFRKAAGFNDLSQERQVAINQYAELMAKADTAKSRADAAKHELDSLRGSNEPSGDGPSTPLSDIDIKQAQADSARLPAARSELEAAKRQYSDDHPNVRRLEAELNALEARVRARANDPSRKRDRVEAAARTSEAKQRAAAEFQGQLKARLDKLSAAEGKAAVLLGELKVADEAREAATQALVAAQIAASQPPTELRIQERAEPPEYALKSPRKRIAIITPLAFAILTALGSVLWAFRKLDVRTPKEAAFWSGVPVVGASTWPRDPDMLPSLMHDLDDFAPHAEGVTLIVGLSLSEAHLARKVAEWDGHRSVKGIDDPSRMLMAGPSGSLFPLAPQGSAPPAGAAGRDPSHQMQILTLTGPVPAQALRRAARMADRVLIVVTSGRHSVLQMLKIKSRLGRDRGIGLLLVGLEKDFALVRDRVGDVSQFWQSTAARS
jgi:uncharacterized protein involved in exopolysaccharide biosynthesis